MYKINKQGTVIKYKKVHQCKKGKWNKKLNEITWWLTILEHPLDLRSCRCPHHLQFWTLFRLGSRTHGQLPPSRCSIYGNPLDGHVVRKIRHWWSHRQLGRRIRWQPLWTNLKIIFVMKNWLMKVIVELGLAIALNLVVPDLSIGQCAKCFFGINRDIETFKNIM